METIYAINNAVRDAMRKNLQVQLTHYIPHLSPQVLASSGLVLIMTPGVAFFYGGMVKHKNVVATLLQNFICMGLVAIAFTMFG